jgi:signal transduction histidine kinase
MLRQAAAIARLGYFIVNLQNDTIETCSTRHAEIFGLTPREFIDRATGLHGELSMVHPDDRRILRNGYRRVHGGQTVEIEYRFRRSDDEWGHICEHIAPEFDADGRVVRALGSSLDVTDAREREAQTLRSKRLETIGVLTAGVAHDFNNILAVIMGNAQLGQAHSPTPLMQELLEEIVEAARRGSRLTNSLLAFSQRATMVPRDVEINQQVKEAKETFDRHHAKNIRIDLDLSEREAQLLVDPDQLQIVLHNVLGNAVDATEPGGFIEVRTRVTASPGRAPDADTGASRAETQAEIVVRDQGCGIPHEALHRVTEPFFTTKGRASRSGLGLSMALGFTQQSGGELHIDSEVGVGTTVTLRFPVQAEAGGTVPVRTRDAGRQKTGHLLLLEDDLRVSEVMCRQLESAGYKVTAVERPEQVFEALSRSEFDVAVFDNIVPGAMNGVDVARDLRSRGIRLPIILLTGLPTHLSDQHLGYVDAFLHKPVTIETLLRQIAICAEAAS